MCVDLLRFRLHLTPFPKTGLRHDFESLASIEPHNSLERFLLHARSDCLLCINTMETQRRALRKTSAVCHKRIDARPSLSSRQPYMTRQQDVKSHQVHDLSLVNPEQHAPLVVLVLVVIILFLFDQTIGGVDHILSIIDCRPENKQGPHGRTCQLHM